MSNNNNALKRVGKAIQLLLSAGCLLFVTNASTAEYQNSYTVSGSTLKDVLEQIALNSKSPDGAFGYTQINTHVGWTANVDADDICTIETVNFNYDITIFMPEWIDKHTAKQCLQDNWNMAWHEVLLHEQRHRDLYRLLDTANIEQRISAIRPRYSCDALEAAVNLEVKKVLDANDKLHDYFHANNSPATLWDC